MRARVIGHFDMTCAEIPSLYSYWEFKENGRAVQDGNELGGWSVMDDCLVVTYDNKEFGHAVLSFDGVNTFVGENVWRTGATYTWKLVAVDDAPRP